MVLLFTGVRGTRLRSAEYSFPSTREEDPVSPAQNAFPNLLPPAAPFLSAVKEMGERMPPKTNGFWISFWSILMQRKKVPQGIGHGPALAAADVVGREVGGSAVQAIIKSRTCRQRRHVQVRPVGPRNIKNTRCCEAYFVERHVNTPPQSR